MSIIPKLYHTLGRINAQLDSLTHIVSGACIGEAIAGKQLGKKALLLGAIAQSLPDIDIVVSPFLSPTDDLLAHRGITHSLLFAIIITPLLAYISRLIFQKSQVSFRKWLWFWAAGLFIHLFIDAFNAYGTGWLEPFSHYRVSFNTLFVLDPLFTICPLIACIALIILRNKSNKRALWYKIGIMGSCIYLAFAITNKLVAGSAVSAAFKKQQITYKRYFTTPTPLNTLLWQVVAENDSGYYIGYRSAFDGNVDINFHYTYRKEQLLQLTANKHDVDNLLRFSNGYYTAALKKDTLVFNDLRFGEIQGWAEDNPAFIFYYYLQYPEANKLAVQRGRFAKWDAQALKRFFKRIAGKA